MTKESDLGQVKALAAKLADIRTQIKAQGGFVGDRNLHQCPACGLMEDVLCGGKLVTCWNLSAQPVDTGLRFKEVGADQLAYPCCGVCRLPRAIKAQALRTPQFVSMTSTPFD